MKTKTLANGSTKVWNDNEAEFKIINKSEPLIDTLIEASLIEKKYSKILVEEIRKAGLDDMHGILLELDDMFQTQMDSMETSELDFIFNEFNSVFAASFKYHKNANGLISILFGQFDNYQEFRRNYFCTFILKMFAGEIDIAKSEKENPELKGLTEFIAKFAPEYMKIYLEKSRDMNFAWVINIINNNHSTQ
ncbi:MAG TPA: hypothetical protein VIK14_17495 [Ignavibacteria bacterium]